MNKTKSIASFATDGGVGVRQKLRATQAANNSYKFAEVASTRDQALLETSVEQIQYMGTEQIILLQRLLQHGDTLGV